MRNYFFGIVPNSSRRDADRLIDLLMHFPKYECWSGQQSASANPHESAAFRCGAVYRLGLHMRASPEEKTSNKKGFAMMTKYLAPVAALALLTMASSVPAWAQRAYRADPPAGRNLYLYAPGGGIPSAQPGFSDDPAFSGGGSVGYNDLVRRDQ